MRAGVVPMKDLSALLASISLAEKIDSRKTSHPLPFMSDTPNMRRIKKNPLLGVREKIKRPVEKPVLRSDLIYSKSMPDVSYFRAKKLLLSSLRISPSKLPTRPRRPLLHD